MKMIKKYNWKYIITFKKGSIPTVYQEFEALLDLEPKNRLTYWKKDIRQDYQWIKGIDHEGHLVNVLASDCVKSSFFVHFASKIPTDFILPSQQTRLAARLSISKAGLETSRSFLYRNLYPLSFYLTSPVIYF